MTLTLPQLIKEQDELHILLAELEEAELSLEIEEEALKEIYENLLQNDINTKEKINAWCWAIVNYQKDSDYYREQSRRFTELARQAENRANKMKTYLSTTVEECGGKYPTADFPKLAIRNTAESVVLRDDYVGDIPLEFRKELSIEELVSKTAIKEALKADKEIPFAYLKRGKALVGLK